MKRRPPRCNKMSVHAASTDPHTASTAAARCCCRSGCWWRGSRTPSQGGWCCSVVWFECSYSATMSTLGHGRRWPDGWGLFALRSHGRPRGGPRLRRITRCRASRHSRYGAVDTRCAPHHGGVGEGWGEVEGRANQCATPCCGWTVGHRNQIEARRVPRSALPPHAVRCPHSRSPGRAP